MRLSESGRDSQHNNNEREQNRDFTPRVVGGSVQVTDLPPDHEFWGEGDAELLRQRTSRTATNDVNGGTAAANDNSFHEEDEVDDVEAENIGNDDDDDVFDVNDDDGTDEDDDGADEDESSDNNTNIDDTNTKKQKQSSKTYHYLKGLEATPKSYLDQVQLSFQSLFSHMITMLHVSTKRNDVGIAVFIIERLALDYEPRDYSFLLNENLVELLVQNVSLITVIEKDESCAPLVKSNAPFTKKKAVDIDMTAALSDGTVTKRTIFALIDETCSESSTGRFMKAWLGAFLKENFPHLYIDGGGDSHTLYVRHFQSLNQMDYREVLLLFESFQAAFATSQKLERAKFTDLQILRTERAKKKDKRLRGARFTYKVTADNGVGVRVLPSVNSSRMGISVLKNEVAEISYRVKLGNNQTFLRLVSGNGFSSAARDRNVEDFTGEEERGQFFKSCKGWLFETGVRSPYCDREIMKCIVTENFASEEINLRERMNAFGVFSDHLISSNLTLANEHSAVVGSEDNKIGVVFGTSLLTPENNFFEIIVRCAGLRNGIGLGVVCCKSRILDRTRGDRTFRSVGEHVGGQGFDNWFGYRCWEKGFYAHGRRVTINDEEISTNSKSEDNRIVEDEVFGCGVDFEHGTIFFTNRNKIIGKIISPSAREKQFFPTVSLGGSCEVVEIKHVNFSSFGNELVKLSAEARSFEEKMNRAEKAKKSEGNCSDAMFDICRVLDDKEFNGRAVADAYAISTEEAEAVELTSSEFRCLSENSWALYQLITSLSVNLFFSKSDLTIPSGSSPKRNRDRADSFYGTNLANDSVQTSTIRLQSCCLNFLINDLVNCANMYEKKKNSANAWHYGDDKSVRIELHSFHELDFLLSIGNYRVCQSYLQRPTFLRSCLKFLMLGSLRIQYSVLRLIRGIVGVTKPAVFSEVLLEETGEEGGFVWYLIERVAKMFVEDHDFGEEKKGELSTFGCGSIVMSIANEDACLVRCLMSCTNWKHACWEGLLKAMQGDREATKLAALYCLGNNDCLRIGAVVSIEDRKLMVNSYSSASTCCGVVDVKCDEDLSLFWGPRSDEIYLPKASMTPVVVMKVGKILDGLENQYFDCLKYLIVSGEEKDSVKYFALRGLSAVLDSSPAFLKMFRDENSFFLHIFNTTLTKDDDAGLVLDENEILLRSGSLRERLIEAARGGGASLKTIERNGKGRKGGRDVAEPLLYKVILKEGAVVRNGISIDKSARVGVLAKGTVVEVLEKAVISESDHTITRLRIANGWISDRLRGAETSYVVERVSVAMSEGVLLEVEEGEDDEEEKIDWSRFPKEGVKHYLHKHPLKYIAPIDIYPESPFMICDHCNLNYPSNMKAAVSSEHEESNWLLCMNCFCMDEDAVDAVIKGIGVDGNVGDACSTNESSDGVDISASSTASMNPRAPANPRESETTAEGIHHLEPNRLNRPEPDQLPAWDEDFSEIGRRPSSEYRRPSSSRSSERIQMGTNDSNSNTRLVTTAVGTRGDRREHRDMTQRQIYANAISNLTDMGYPLELATNAFNAGLTARRRDGGGEILHPANVGEVINRAIDYLNTGSIPTVFDDDIDDEVGDDEDDMVGGFGFNF